MFDPAAISLTSALNPAAIPANAVMLENAGTPGDVAEPAQTGGFEAMLALQSAKAQIALPTNRMPQQTVAKLGLPPLAQPATGKTLPEAATPLAALAAFAGDDAGLFDDASDHEEAALEFIADPAVLASIFAAPDRLTSAPADHAPSSLAKTEQILPDVAPIAAATQPVIAKAVAMAQAAVIELEPSPAPVLPADAAATLPAPLSVVANLQARPATPARTGTKAPDPAIEPSGATLPSAAFKDVADQAALPDMSEDIAAPIMARAADAAPAQDAAPAGRAEPRAERVDFATLVETLNRAREEASPNTVRVSLSHTDFGRVSMRFERDDNGMSVAMSSADPGFVRAVTASNEAASTASSSDNQRGQSSQANTSAQSEGRAQGEGNRQQQGQRADTPERPAAQLRDTLRRKDDPGSSSGIFA